MSILPTRNGAVRLFRLAGIDVFLHWSWFVVAYFEINHRARDYTSIGWNALEYLALFSIVLLHEFGHSLACRQVGGKADQIILWPLGGVAYVAPPQRPGATLWSIAAGPLVNVVLAPVFITLYLVAVRQGWADTQPNLFQLLRAVCVMNVFLLVFNLLPVFPLDGGQILRSILWFFLDRARSLMVAVFIGFGGVAILVGLALLARSWMLGIMAGFILLNCWGGLNHARLLARVARFPRRPGYTCPDCLQPPVLGPYWRCARCAQPFDPFETHAVCPHCGAQFSVTQCLDCGSSHPLGQWFIPPPAVPR